MSHSSRSSRFKRRFSLCAVVVPLLAALPACESPNGAGTVPASSDGTTVDQVEIVSGVSDQGRDPAVVALDVAEIGLCTATLIAPDVILTARHCVSKTVETVTCPSTTPQITGARAASSLTVLLGDTVSTAHAAAHGKKVLTPPGDILCDADIAIVILDQPIEGIDPLTVSAQGVAVGDFVTAVGYGSLADGDPPGTKLLREHVAVLAATSTEFTVGEATCQGDSGGPAIDETTGDVFGVVSRGGPTCAGAGVHNIYTRVDAFSSLIAEGLAAASAPTKPSSKSDAGAKATSGPTDIGNTCTQGSDCATGVCVTHAGTSYCSRDCGSADRCPRGYRCTGTDDGAKVCLADSVKDASAE